MSATKKYRQKNGRHVQDGIRFGIGDVIESRRPLDRIFPGKFEEVPDDTPASEGQNTSAVEVVLPDHPAPEQREELIPEVLKAEEPKTEASKEEASKTEAPKTEEPKTSGSPSDVTAEFKDAVEAKVKILLSDTEGYIVVDEATSEKKNQEALMTKKAVKTFLATLV